MNNIAVVLRGHARTWNFCKVVLLDKLSQLATNIDFYFSTWNTNTTSIKEIQKDFEKYNLKELIVNPVSSKYYQNYQSIAWLSQQVIDSNEFIKNKSNYDAVIDTRPDIVPCYFKLENKFSPEKNCVYAEFSNNQRMSDLFLLFNVETFELFSKRYLDIDIYLRQYKWDIHSSLWKWCYNNNLISNEKIREFWYSQIIRPDILNFHKYAEEIINWNDKPHHLTLSKEWNLLSYSQKEVFLKHHDIDLLDYNLLNTK